MSIQLYQGSPFIGVGAFQGQISGSTIRGAGLPGSLSGSATLVAGGYASGATSTEGNTVTASIGHYLQCSVAFSSSGRPAVSGAKRAAALALFSAPSNAEPDTVSILF